MGSIARKGPQREPGNSYLAANTNKITPSMARRAWTLIRCYGWTLREVGSNMGLTDNEALEAFLRHDKRHERRLYQDGVRDGRLGPFPIQQAA